MKKIGIFYGPEKGSVEKVAGKLVEKLGADRVDMHPVKHADAETLNRYENIIFGISTVGRETWDAEYNSEDWDRFLPKITGIDFSRKKIAMYGLGDQVRYARDFVNALGGLGRLLLKNNANIIGQVSTEGYNFEDSEGIHEGLFFGLPLDEDNEPEKTDARLDRWVAQIVSSFD